MTSDNLDRSASTTPSSLAKEPPSLVVMTGEDLMSALDAAVDRWKNLGAKIEVIPGYEPQSFDIVVRNHGPSAGPGAAVRSAGFEIIDPITGHTTGDRLGIEQVVLAILEHAGVTSTKSMTMLAPEEWASRRAQEAASQRESDARKAADAFALYLRAQAIQGLLDTFDSPNAALTEGQRAICDAARTLLPPDLSEPYARPVSCGT